MATGTLVGSGRHTYEVDEEWAKIPTGWNVPAAAVAVDSQDRVYCFNRDPHHPLIVFDRQGNYLSSWGDGVFRFAHAIVVDGDDNLWLVDRDHGQIMQFTPEGKSLMTVGEKDPMGPKASEIVHAAMPRGRAELLSVPDKGHWLQLEAVEDIISALDQWLEKFEL